ncbi:MAG: Golgi Transport [Chaenotheca gracillima]|nr:MAG: Golgi Transport [Chaenotheca gracillima]
MPPANAAADEAHQLLLESLDIAMLPKPFRKPNWKPPQRRNKNIKQILTEASRKEASLFPTQNNSGASTPLPAGSNVASAGDATPDPSVDGVSRQPNIAQAAQNLSTLVLEKNLRAANANATPSGPAVTYTNVESAPSLHPAYQKRYCDITGLHAPYTDPKSRLRYHDKEIFGVVRGLGQGVAENYLEARGAHVILK